MQYADTQKPEVGRQEVPQIVKYAAQPIRHLDPEQQRRLIHTAAREATLVAQRDKAFMSALLHSGMRVEEFSLVTLRQVKFALSTGYHVIPAENRKGDVGHTIHVTAAYRHDLEDLLRVREQMTGTKTADAGGDAPLVVNRYGKRLSVRSYQKRVGYWAMRAGIATKVTPHTFRHSKAMNIIRHSEAKEPLRVVQKVLGHVSLNSTGVYVQATEDEVRRASEEADGMRPMRKRQAMKMFMAGGVA